MSAVIRPLLAGTFLMLPLMSYADGSLSNYSNQQSSGISALSKVILSTSLESISTFASICSPSEGKGIESASEREIVAASGYDRMAVPYEALDEPGAFCSCAIQVAAKANQIVAKRLGVSGFTAMPDADARAYLQSKTSGAGGGGSTSCRSGSWRVDFTATGLALFYNGAPVYGGTSALISGRSVNYDTSVSQSWVAE